MAKQSPCIHLNQTFFTELLVEFLSGVHIAVDGFIDAIEIILAGFELCEMTLVYG